MATSTGPGRRIWGPLWALIVSTALVVWYFHAPLSPPWSVVRVVELVAGLILVAAIVVGEIVAVLRSPRPRLRAAGALVLTLPMLVVLFAAAYVIMSAGRPGSFSEPLTRVGALYFSMTIFSTVGFGDIAARTDPARILVMVQMLADLTYVGLFVRAIFEAVRIGEGRNDS